MRNTRRFIHHSILLILVVVGLAGCANPDSHAAPATQQPADTVQRVVALGDVHGDFDQLVRMLQMANVIDDRHRWTGGSTHVVQLGDIPDRGPDTRKAMDLLMKLQASARKSGGAVTVLIGNHEAMMMTGDLRYVHPGEYAAFKSRNSKALQDAYYRQTVERLQRVLPPEELPVFDDAYREQWETRFPQGYVEHRRAWAPDGKYGKWVLDRPAAVVVLDTLFVHGGISVNYADTAISEINNQVRTALAQGESLPPDTVVDDSLGPLWDRSWANQPQSTENAAQLDEVLKKLGVNTMVIAHTPVAPIIIPRFGGRVLLADVGLSAHYGSGSAYLEILDNKKYAVINGERLALPHSEAGIDAYLDAAEALVEDPAKIIRYRELLQQQKIEDNQQELLESTGAAAL